MRSESDDFITEYLSVVCGDVTPCCTAHAYVPNADRCRQTHREKYMSRFALAGFDESKASDCLALVRARVAECRWLSPDDVSTVCDLVFFPLGKRALGESCERVDDCAPPTLPSGRVDCDGNSNTCTQHVPGALGDTCTDAPTEYTCPPGAHCDLRGSKTCVPDAAIGESCPMGYMVECAPEVARCDYDTKTCVALSAMGEMCEPSHGLACGEGLACGGSVCVAGVKRGEPCGGQAYCATGLQCGRGTRLCEPLDSVATKERCGQNPFLGRWYTVLEKFDVAHHYSLELVFSETDVTQTFALADAQGNAMGAATFSGTFTYRPREGDRKTLDLTMTLTHAEATDGASQPVSVTEGSCASCDGFLLGTGNPLPTTCVCKQQTVGALQMGERNMWLRTLLDASPLIYQH